MRNYNNLESVQNFVLVRVVYVSSLFSLGRVKPSRRRFWPSRQWSSRKHKLPFLNSAKLVPGAREIAGECTICRLQYKFSALVNHHLYRPMLFCVLHMIVIVKWGT